MGEDGRGSRLLHRYLFARISQGGGVGYGLKKEAGCIVYSQKQERPPNQYTSTSGVSRAIDVNLQR